MVIAANLDDPARLTDLAASNLELKLEEAQQILETIDPIERLRKVNELVIREINLLTMQQEISTAAQGEMNKSQREYFLRQQLKAIQIGARRGRRPPGGGRELPEEDRGEEHPGGSEGGGREAAQATRAVASRLRRDLDHPHVPGLDDRTALGRDVAGQPRSRARPHDPRRGPLRPREDQGADPRVSRRPQTEGDEDEGADPLLRRPSRSRQDLAGTFDRARARSQVRAALARRRPRRGGDPRPPPHVRRRSPGPHRAGDQPGADVQPGLHARRGRQDRQRTIAAIPRRRCSRSSTRNRTSRSAITTSASPTTSRT